MENISDSGLVLKKDDKKKEGGFGKGTKDRLLGSLNNKREKLGNKLFPKDFLTVEKRSSIPKELTSASPFVLETMIMYLLSQKAKVNARDRYGSTPLHYAVAKGNPDAVKELLTDQGIDIEVGNIHVHIHYFVKQAFPYEPNEIGPHERAFSHSGRAKNWGESKKVEGAGWGRGKRGVLACKPLNSEKCPPTFHG